MGTVNVLLVAVFQKKLVFGRRNTNAGSLASSSAETTTETIAAPMIAATLLNSNTFTIPHLLFPTPYDANAYNNIKYAFFFSTRPRHESWRVLKNAQFAIHNRFMVTLAATERSNHEMPDAACFRHRVCMDAAGK